MSPSRALDTIPCPYALKEWHYLKGRLNNFYPNTHLCFIFCLNRTVWKDFMGLGDFVLYHDVDRDFEVS